MGHLTATTEDGWTLRADVIAAAGPRRGVALLLHAMMVDRRSMDRPRGGGLASTLAACGWDVVLADFRGHGASVPLPKDGGVWSYADLVFYDVPALTAAVRDRFPGPMLVVGHSLGAHVSMASIGVSACEPPDAAVLFSANVWLPQLEPSPGRRLLKSASLALWRAGSEVVGHSPARRTRFGTADEAIPYVRDLERFWRLGWWGDATHDYLTSLDNVDVPVLSILGRGDRLMAHRVGAEAWGARLGAEHWVVGKGDHGLPVDPGHMDVVTHPGAVGLWRAAAAWAGDRAP